MDRCWNHSPGAHYPPGPEPWRAGRRRGRPAEDHFHPNDLGYAASG